MTRREEIIKLLSERAESAHQLANHYKVTLKEILEDLEHIAKSVKPKRLKQIPARCKHCGFIFKERSKVKRPSRCPRCRNERIQAQLFRIE